MQMQLEASCMVSTRPDLAFGVGLVSRFMSNPSKEH